ncbi:MAG: cytochrome b N-terminal domain-containing protein [Gemmatimonadota bacterium]
MNDRTDAAPIAEKHTHLDKPSKAGNVVTERLAWNALEYPVPPSANRMPYMLGGITFFGILVLILTGVFLDQFYNPSPLGAHESLAYIMTRVQLGNWIRSVHYWAASLVLVTIVLHLAYVFWRRSYCRPREITWWSGTAMLLVIFALAFTGTVLRGDQEGGEALAHAVAGAELVGVPGVVMTPDFAPSTSLLARLHNAHVSLLPLALFGLIALHFFLIRHLGINSREPKTHVFTMHLRRLTGLGLVFAAIIGMVAALFPPGLGFPAVDGVEVTKPFWPFLWIYAAENTLGMVGMLIAPAVIFGFLFMVPVIDRRPNEAGGRPRWVSATAAAVALLYLIALVYGIFAPKMQHLGM